MEAINDGITKIKNGCIDYYYSLKVESDLKIYDLCESIQTEITSTIDNYNLKVISMFEKQVQESISKLGIKEFNVKADYNLEKRKDKILNLKPYEMSQEIVGIKLETASNGFKLIPISEVYEQINEIQNELEEEFDFNSEIYGKAFVDNYRMFKLPPYKIQLINNCYVFIKAVLYIFQNGMMILRITLPLKDLEIIPLFENNTDKYIKNIIDVCDFGNEIKDNTIDEIKNSYYKYILGSSKKNKNIIYISKVIQNIILADFDGIPSNVKDISKNTEEDLYKIIVAPIQKRDDISFEKRAKQYLNNNSYTCDGIKYITNSMGKCISIIDKDSISYIENDIDYKDRDKEEIYKMLINSVRRNIDFTFVIMLLKNMNSTLTYFQKEINSNNVHKVQKEYNYNVIFILQLQQTCFGSVREQLSFFENKMIFFLDKKSTKERMNAIDAIIEDEKHRRNFNFQNFLSIGGFLLTLIFGLPAIHETLTILRKSNIFIKKNIPIVTVENCSIIIWIVLIIFLSFIMYLKNVNIKNFISKVKVFLKSIFYHRKKIKG